MNFQSAGDFLSGSGLLDPDVPAKSVLLAIGGILVAYFLGSHRAAWRSQIWRVTIIGLVLLPLGSLLLPKWSAFPTWSVGEVTSQFAPMAARLSMPSSL